MNFMSVIGYIDPGSTSYLLAALAGGLAGIWLLIKEKFTTLFQKNKDKNRDKNIDH
jgi:hypothetical protein